MVITRTPLRISFAGGGSDLPAFYREEPGAVLATAVDQYVYLSANRKFDGRIRASYSRTELADHVDGIEHELIREALRHTGITGAIEITSVSDIPSRGTGLGSSSAYTVGLLHTLYTYRGESVRPERLAREACAIEIERCGKTIGKQDQYIAAYGGLQHITFFPDGSVKVDAVHCGRNTLDRLEAHILLFYTGRTRRAESILAEQAQRTTTDQKVRRRLRRMAALSHDLRQALEQDNLHAMGELLHEAWMEKRLVSPGITTRSIDAAYETARRHGALGGKILGAGGGGFLLLFAPPESHAGILEALGGLRHVPVKLETDGSRLLYVDPRLANRIPAPRSEPLPDEMLGNAGS
jgi:D-glycero-alpha-D-manno-heptose-7-phosphate kinase